MLRSTTHCVRRAINLDRQAPLEASEIDDKAASRKLASKPKAARALAQLLPHYDLGERQLPTKLAGETNIIFWSADRAMPGAD